MNTNLESSLQKYVSAQYHVVLLLEKTNICGFVVTFWVFKVILGSYEKTVFKNENYSENNERCCSNLKIRILKKYYQQLEQYNNNYRSINQRQML
jgi:hypothetical protein